MAKINQSAFDVGQLSERLFGGYLGHLSSLAIASDARAAHIVPPVVPGQSVPIGKVIRKDGTEWSYDFAHFLRLAKSDTMIATETERVWIAGALLRLGDALTQNQYFDRAPELELVRHLRNGIAHGNRFRIDDPEKLRKFPAHNRYAWIRSDKKTVFEITDSLQGQPVLFDYIAAGDVLDLLLSVGKYLIRMGNGDPLRPTT
jgi:hypothetical protein